MKPLPLFVRPQPRALQLYRGNLPDNVGISEQEGEISLVLQIFEKFTLQSVVPDGINLERYAKEL